MARKVGFNTNHVLQLVVDLFWKKGYSQCTVKDLVDVTGLSKSSLYNTFGDKRSLFIQVLKTYQSQSLSELDSIVNKEGSSIELIRNLLESVQEKNIDRSDKKGCFVQNTAIELASLDNEIKKLVANHKLNMLERIESIISKDYPNGISNMNLRELSYFFFCLLQGLVVTKNFSKEPKLYQSTINLSLKLLDPN